MKKDCKLVLIMKRYIVILFITTVTLFTANEKVHALGLEFSSTSTMVGSGSNLSAGESFSYQSADDYYTASVRPNIGRKFGITDDSDSDDGDSENDPGQWVQPEHENEPLPVGDGVWVLLFLAAGYAIIRRRKVKLAK